MPKDPHAERLDALNAKRAQFEEAGNADKLKRVEAKIVEAKAAQQRAADKATAKVTPKPEKTKRAEAKANRGSRKR
jgi:hypothetical protein